MFFNGMQEKSGRPGRLCDVMMNPPHGIFVQNRDHCIDRYYEHYNSHGLSLRARVCYFEVMELFEQSRRNYLKGEITP